MIDKNSEYANCKSQLNFTIKKFVNLPNISTCLYTVVILIITYVICFGLDMVMSDFQIDRIFHVNLTINKTKH